MRRTSKKFRDRAYVVLRLHAIGRQSVAVVSNVPQGGVVVPAPTSVVQSSDGDSAAQAAAGNESAVSIEKEAAEGVNADVATELTEDEAFTAIAMGDPLAFAIKVSEAVAASSLDTDELAAPRPGTTTLDAGLEKCQRGELPDDNDQYVPQDIMIGFQSMGGTLTELFDIDVVGRLAPETSIGAIVA
jgi:hypothetical protein